MISGYAKAELRSTIREEARGRQKKYPPFRAAVHTDPDIFLIRNFFFPDTVSVHRYLVNPAYESATFLICCPECKFLNTLLTGNHVDAEPGNPG